MLFLLYFNFPGLPFSVLKSSGKRAHSSETVHKASKQTDKQNSASKPPQCVSPYKV